MPFKPHPTDPDKVVYVPREYDLPAEREWVGLTEERVDELARTMVKGHKSVNWLARAIEDDLRKENT